MRILYLGFIEPDIEGGGVAKKIAMQIAAWRDLGHETIFQHMTPEPLVRQPTLNAWMQLKKTRNRIESYQPDIIYSREMHYMPGLQAVLSSASFVLEINSDALAEYKGLHQLHYKMFGSRLPDAADGIIFVSEELRSQCHSQCKALKTVIANGYDIENATIILRDNSHLGAPSFVFVGSSDQAWNGLDELEALAAELPDCTFHVVAGGYSSSAQNIVAHGVVYGSGLREIYAQADVGLSTLALYRKFMKEASALKVREYLAHGLPTVLFYRDTDLRELTASEGVLQLRNAPASPKQHAPEILQFAKSWQGKRVSHSITAPLISSNLKEQKRLKFFDQVMRNTVQ